MVAGATIISAVATVKATYNATYDEEDFVPILFDGMGTVGSYVVTKIGTIGSLLLVIFVVGSVYTIVSKSKAIMHL
jgi:hypothetical protein